MSEAGATVEWSREDSVRLFREQRFLPNGSRAVPAGDGIQIEWRRSFFFSVVLGPAIILLFGGVFMSLWVYLGSDRAFLSPKAAQALSILLPLSVLFFSGLMLLMCYAKWKRKQGAVYANTRGNRIEWPGGSREVEPGDELYFVVSTTTANPDSNMGSRHIWPYGHLLIGHGLHDAEHICSFVYGRRRNMKIAESVARELGVGCRRITLREPASRIWDEDISRYALSESVGW